MIFEKQVVNLFKKMMYTRCDDTGRAFGLPYVLQPEYDEALSLAGDIYIIMLGTNGGLDPEKEVPGNGDFRELLTLCRKDAPGAAIYICTPPHVTVNPMWSNCGYRPQVEKAVAFVRNLAKEMDFPVIETALCPDFTDENEGIMQPNDGLHFGLVGYETLAKFIAGAIRK